MLLETLFSSPFPCRAFPVQPFLAVVPGDHFAQPATKFELQPFPLNGGNGRMEETSSISSLRGGPFYV